MAGWNPGDLQENVGQGGTSLNSERNPSSWTDLLKRTYGLYRERFDEYFPLVLAGGIVAAAAYFSLEHLRAMIANMPAHQPSLFDQPSPSFYFRRKLIDWLLWCSQVVVVWMATLFTFAWVSAKLAGAANAAFSRTVPAAQAFRSAMTQFGKIAAAAFLGALATILFSGILIPILLRPLPFLFFYLHSNYRGYSLTYSLGRGLVLIVFGVLLSRMAPAIPNLVDNPGRSLRDAVRGALRDSRERQALLFLWLGASAVLGGLAYFMAADALLTACTHGSVTPTGCTVLLDLLAVVMIALLAGPAFICFSLLYFESNFRERASLSAPAR
jgi:hypothetical protein